MSKRSKTITSIITQSPIMKGLIDQIVRAARSSASILISGESGTGKELFSRLIHENSQRTGELVSVNCAALPSNLVESELFGHEKGAFTDAIQQRIGRFEQAHSGTLLLDEVTEIPLSTQAKLLRVLESNEFQRIGNNTTIETNVRVVATSNRDIRKEVDEGNFRLDLYHRLNVIEVRIPPLRERAVDIPLLVTHFINQFKHENPNLISGLSHQAMQMVCRHPWPGNVRELKNSIHRACVLSTHPLIQPDCIVPRENTSNESGNAGIPVAWESMSLAEIERRVILASLRKFGTKREAADRLGVTSRTLANKLKLYGRAA